MTKLAQLTENIARLVPRSPRPATTLAMRSDSQIKMPTAAATAAALPLVLEAVAKARDTGKYFGILKFKTRDGSWRQDIIPMSLLRKPKALIERLDDAGAALGDGVTSDEVTKQLAAGSMKATVEIVYKTGWVGPDAYVFNDKIIGPGRDGYLYQPPFGAQVESRAGFAGSLDAWQTEVAGPAQASAIAMHGIALAFASIVGSDLKVESGGFHIFGPNSIGKSSVTVAAQSVLYHAEKDKLTHWDATETGLEQLTLRCNNGLLVLDEIGRLAEDAAKAAKTAMKLSYRIAGGHGRIRAGQYESKYQRCEWHVFFISNGEFGIGALNAGLGQKRHGGDVIRMIDLPAHIGGANGIFDALPDNISAAELVQQMVAGAEANYGRAGRAFIREYIGDGNAKRRLERYMASFHEALAVKPSGREGRFVARFALAYAAALLAIRYGILPWSKTRLKEAMTLCYRNALAARPDNAQVVAASVEEVRQALRAGEGILDWRKAANRKLEDLEQANGFRRRDRDGVEFIAVTKAAMLKWTGGKVDLAALSRALLRQGALISQGRDLPTKQIMVGGDTRASFYCFTESFYKA